MSDLARWPNLKIATHPMLDWVEPVYDATLLLEMAKAVSENPHPIQTRTAAGMPGVWDPVIEGLLRALAEKPAALKLLNEPRPTMPREVKGLNRAVHYHVRLELRDGRVKDALADVAEVWGKSEDTIKEDRTMFSVNNRKKNPERNPRRYLPDDAERIAAQVINDSMVARRMTRTEVLAAFDADMKHRAAQLHK